ncbi:MAG TPA: hypothetical protein VH351_01975 [Bryobacteraceae bacterium]|jgi:hypothetical protein|nr:hypothetical protein [Bryobacteraceae bacterium]
MALLFVLSAKPQQPPASPSGSDNTPRTPLSSAVTAAPNGTKASPQGTPLPDVTTSNTAGVPMEFQSHGLTYEALTKEGITVMFAILPSLIKDFEVIQFTVTNGSQVNWTVKPTDFSFVRQDGITLPASSADMLVESLLVKAGRNDVIKLQMMYENTIYALSNFRSTNGYEQRREAAMAQFVNYRFSAAAAASAIAFTPVKLKPGDSTDGAVFFELRAHEKSLGTGILTAHTCGQIFVFQVVPEPKLH